MIINCSSWQYVLPKRFLSYLVGKLARCRIVWLKNLLIDLFIKKYAISMHDAVEQNPHNYPYLESFFIRHFQPGARPFAARNNTISSPADGKISQFGKIIEGCIIQAKGRKFSALELLGGMNDMAEDFVDGDFATIYLAPSNYHHVYMPIDGTLHAMRHIPGKLFSVNNCTAKNVPNLFARNERLVLVFQTSIGRVALILVGAMIVSSIYTSWANQDSQSIYLKRGEEVGYFTFGSTVIMLLPKNAVNWNKKRMQKDQEILTGQTIGTIIHRPDNSNN